MNTTASSPPVNDAQAADYRRQGVVLLRGVIDRALLDILAKGVARCLARPGSRAVDYSRDEASGRRFYYEALTVRDNASFEDFVVRSPTAEIAARLMDSRTATAAHVSVFVRSPGVAKRSPWHQDQPFWGMAGQQTCSTWIPLDPVPQETALEFIPGSHLQGKIYTRQDFGDSPRSGSVDPHLGSSDQIPDIEANRAAHNIVGWTMAPGDCLVFHGMVLHGGSGNLPSSLGRRALSFQWLGDDVRVQHQAGGVDPDFRAELTRRGIGPGDPPACDLFPIAWPRQHAAV